MSQNRFFVPFATLLFAALLNATAYAAPLELNEPQSANLQKVVNVAQGDTLNMRAGAGMQHPVLAKIPHNGLTIVATGRRKGNWAEVFWMGQTGWVNAQFLKPMSSGAKASVDAVDTQMAEDAEPIMRPTKDMFRPKFSSQDYWKERPYWKQPNLN